jgi:hypothetical protein
MDDLELEYADMILEGVKEINEALDRILKKLDEAFP